MTDKQVKKYCNGLCDVCDELGIYNEEPCIYKIANKLEEKLLYREQECEELKRCLLQVQNASISLNKKLDQFKQTLIEIKEIAKSFCNACQEFEPEKRG